MPPSVVFRLNPEDELLCYSFDHAITTFANALKERIRVVTKDAKNDKQAQAKAESVMRQWLYSDQKDKPASGKFRDPMASGKVVQQ